MWGGFGECDVGKLNLRFDKQLFGKKRRGRLPAQQQLSWVRWLHRWRSKVSAHLLGLDASVPGCRGQNSSFPFLAGSCCFCPICENICEMWIPHTSGGNELKAQFQQDFQRKKKNKTLQNIKEGRCHQGLTEFMCMGPWVGELPGQLQEFLKALHPVDLIKGDWEETTDLP